VVLDRLAGRLDLLVEHEKDRLDGGADRVGTDVQSVLLHLAHLAQGLQAAHEGLERGGLGWGRRPGAGPVEGAEAGDEDGVGLVRLGAGEARAPEGFDAGGVDTK
jgi:hypothetical protein